MSFFATFEELECWKAARNLRMHCAQLTRGFPLAERHRLADQLLRSSRSVVANIAEGFGRFSYKENIQYCRQARGSLTEVLEHLCCAMDEGYIDSQVFNDSKKDVLHCWKILNGYISYLQKQVKSNCESRSKYSNNQ